MDSLSTSRRIGLMGGSFDPIHLGHLIIAQDAIEHLKLDEVVFIPASIPPHKQQHQQADIAHRLKMIQQAACSYPYFSVSDLEACRGGVSYTYDTVSAFRDLHPATDLTLIVGSDTLVDLHNWYRIEDLLELCDVASFLRPGESDIEEIRSKVMLSDPLKNRVMDKTFQTHLIDISSSEIRQRIAEDQRIHFLVSQEVEDYINKQGLYRG